MSTVLVIKNSENEGPALLGKLLTNDGFKLQTVFAPKQKIPDGDYSLVLILGAPESANDDLQYLRDEMDLIRNFSKSDIPVLGICLGSQLIAKAFGARVYKGSKKEIGFFHDLTHKPDKLFADFQNLFTVFHWHVDTFDLPKNATRLVSSDYYENQAFRVGATVGIQFHLEVDESTIVTWLNAAKKKMTRASSIDFNLIENEINQYLPIVNKNLETFYRNFRLAFRL